MAADRIDMRNIREVLRLHFVSKRNVSEIARGTACSRSTVRDYLFRARTAGLIQWPQIEALDEVVLEQMLFPVLPKNLLSQQPRPLPDWSEIHSELMRSRTNLTLHLLWQEYKETYSDGYQYSQFATYYGNWKKKLSLSMRQLHRAGERAFVDYCDGLSLVDLKTGELIPTQLFVGVLGASSYTFVEASLSQDLSHFVTSHVHMYEFFMGVPAITTPDNLRSAIKRSCRYEPSINPSYNEMARHYGTAIIPARVRKPKDKGKVENAVLIAQRWILSRLRNCVFHSIQELNHAIAELLTKMNAKVMRQVNKSRHELWESIDRPALKPLPSSPYDYADWEKGRLGVNYHARYEDNYYSAPYTLYGEELWCRATVTTVELFHKGKRIASHFRVFGKTNDYSTLKEHMPPAHRAVAEWTPERVGHWASKIGPRTRALVDEIMCRREHPQQGFNAALGVIRLAKKHGEDRLEMACDRVLKLGASSYTSVKNTLHNRMEAVPIAQCLPGFNSFNEDDGKLNQPRQFENVRDHNYYH